MDGVVVQQQPERNSGGRDGSWQDHPDHSAHHVPHGEQESQRAASHHRALIVSRFTGWVYRNFRCISRGLYTDFTCKTPGCGLYTGAAYTCT